MIRMFEPCFILYTDNDREFVNSSVKAFCEEFNIRHVRGCVWCPWIKWQVEWLNQTLKCMLSAILTSKGINEKWT